MERTGENRFQIRFRYSREKTVPYRLPSQISIDKVETAFGILKTKRPREVYGLRKTGDKSYDIDVTYIDTDTSKSLAFQREEKKFTIELEEIGGQLRLRAAHGEKPSAIVQQFISSLRDKDTESAEVEEIKLTAIRDHKMRTRFFMLLLDSIKGFTTTDVKDLKLDSRFPTETPESEEEANEGESFDEDSTAGEKEGESLKRKN